jgi:hypothetical protein
MLQSLGVSGSAEALYMLLAPLEAASESELVELGSISAEETAAVLAELQDLGLARPTGTGAWEPLPLLPAVGGLRIRRVAEIEAATAAAETLQNRLLARTQEHGEGNVNILVGREAILETRL